MNKDELNNAFYDACKDGDLDKVKYFLTSPELTEHANIHYYGDWGLRTACLNGHSDIVEYLLTSPELTEHAYVHSDDDGGLRWACQHGHYNVLTPLFLAMKDDSPEQLYQLYEKVKTYYTFTGDEFDEFVDGMSNLYNPDLKNVIDIFVKYLDDNKHPHTDSYHKLSLWHVDIDNPQYYKDVALDEYYNVEIRMSENYFQDGSNLISVHIDDNSIYYGSMSYFDRFESLKQCKSGEHSYMESNTWCFIPDSVLKFAYELKEKGILREIVNHADNNINMGYVSIPVSPKEILEYKNTQSEINPVFVNNPHIQECLTWASRNDNLNVMKPLLADNLHLCIQLFDKQQIFESIATLSAEQQSYFYDKHKEFFDSNIDELFPLYLENGTPLPEAFSAIEKHDEIDILI